MYKKGAVYYDRINSTIQKDDLLFYKRLIGPQYKNILELACGTGRILFSLADGVRTLTGIDISEDMLSVAKEKKSDDSCTLICADMTRLETLGCFDAIICGFNSVQHILDEELLYSFYEGIYRNLSDNGIAVIDLFQTDMQYLFPEGNLRTIAEFSDAESGSVVVEEYSKYDKASSVNQITYRYFLNHKLDFEEHYQMKQYAPEYMDAVILRSRFTIDRKFGDYDFSLFSASSPKQIFILKKKD